MTASIDPDSERPGSTDIRQNQLIIRIAVLDRTSFTAQIRVNYFQDCQPWSVGNRTTTGTRVSNQNSTYTTPPSVINE